VELHQSRSLSIRHLGLRYGGQSHGRSQIEDHPVSVWLSMGWVCLESIDVKVLVEIGRVVLDKFLNGWLFISYTMFGIGTLMETMACKTVRNLPATSRDDNASVDWTRNFRMSFLTVCWVTGVLERGPLLPRVVTVSSSEMSSSSTAVLGRTVKPLQVVTPGNGVSGGASSISIDTEVTLVLSTWLAGGSGKVLSALVPEQ
jgi:hypothetical protein